jgi:hypothetical protein
VDVFCNKKIVGEISRATLKAEIGDNLADKAVSTLKGKILIPNIDQLRRGDIVLSRSSTRTIAIKSSPVVLGQRMALTKDFSAEASSWCHAMVYVGNMYITDSQPFSMKNNWRSGLRTAALTNYCKNSDLLICRHKQYNYVGDDIAQYALLNYVANPRKYPHFRTVFNTIMDKASPKNLYKSANCGEFALECLAIAGACLVDTYERVQKGVEEFYPASFHNHGDFDMIEMEYLTLVDE